MGLEHLTVEITTTPEVRDVLRRVKEHYVLLYIQAGCPLGVWSTGFMLWRHRQRRRTLARWREMFSPASPAAIAALAQLGVSFRIKELMRNEISSKEGMTFLPYEEWMASVAASEQARLAQEAADEMAERMAAVEAVAETTAEEAAALKRTVEADD